jgi:hypothetical protein
MIIYLVERSVAIIVDASWNKSAVMCQQIGFSPPLSTTKINLENRINEAISQSCHAQ